MHDPSTYLSVTYKVCRRFFKDEKYSALSGLSNDLEIRKTFIDLLNLLYPKNGKHILCSGLYTFPMQQST